MTSFDKLADYDISRIKLLTDFSYDDALIGVTEDSRAIYDYDKMVKWINYNTIRALDYAGSDSPIIMHALA